MAAVIGFPGKSDPRLNSLRLGSCYLGTAGGVDFAGTDPLFFGSDASLFGGMVIYAAGNTPLGFELLPLYSVLLTLAISA